MVSYALQFINIEVVSRQKEMPNGFIADSPSYTKQKPKSRCTQTADHLLSFNFFSTLRYYLRRKGDKSKYGSVDIFPTYIHMNVSSLILQERTNSCRKVQTDRNVPFSLWNYIFRYSRLVNYFHIISILRDMNDLL